MEILLMLLQMVHHLKNTIQAFSKTLVAADVGVFENVKIAVPLKYLSNFFRSLEM